LESQNAETNHSSVCRGREQCKGIIIIKKDPKKMVIKGMQKKHGERLGIASLKTLQECIFNETRSLSGA
jgi:hypothetical protein